MSIQQQHLPQDRPATSDEEYGFTIENFIGDNWPYLLGAAIVLAIFLYARYSWRKRHEK